MTMSSKVAEKIKSSDTDKNIMADICAVLEKKKIDFQKSSQSEIMIKDQKKKEILSIIKPLVGEDNFSILLEVVETKKTVYIRKKISTN